MNSEQIAAYRARHENRDPWPVSSDGLAVSDTAHAGEDGPDAWVTWPEDVRKAYRNSMGRLGIPVGDDVDGVEAEIEEDGDIFNETMNVESAKWMRGHP